MNNVTFEDIYDLISNTTTTYAIIDRGNNEYTSMPKSVYDEMQKAELNGNN